MSAACAETAVRPRRFRFRMRTLLLLPLVVGFAFAALDRVFVANRVRQGIERVHLRLVDARTGRPVDGDRVAVMGIDPREVYEKGSTDAAGNITFHVPYGYRVRKGVFRTVRRPLVNYGVEIRTPGYVTTFFLLNDRRRGSGEDLALPDPVIVRLRPIR